MKQFTLEDRVLNFEPSQHDERDYPILLSSSAEFPKVHKPSEIEALLDEIMVDQGKTGSCVGQALAKLMSIIAFRQSGVVYKYSPYWLWVNRIAWNGPNGKYRDKTEGTNPKYQASLSTREGACFAEQYVLDISNDYKYDDLDDYFYNTIRPAFLHTAKTHGADKYAMAKTEDEIKQAILDNGGLLIGVRVYDSWRNIGKDGKIPMPKTGEASRGGHAMMVYGWDDEKRVWYGHNSWGKDWGNNGFFEISYDYQLLQNVALLDSTNMHWAHKFYYYLWEKGVKIYDQRFDDPITRGEVFTLLAKMMGYED